MTANRHEQMLEVLQRFRVLLRAIDVHYRRAESRSGLGGAQIWALSEIASSPGVQPGDLAKRMAIHPSTASNLLRRLEALGFVVRTRENHDKRRVVLRATPAGLRKLRSAPKPLAGPLQEALLALSTRRLASLQRDLDEVLSKFTRLDPSAKSVLIPAILSNRAAPKSARR
jgi:DNA-binding MarR family transcriptional regulator